MNLKSNHDLIKELFQRIEEQEQRIKKLESCNQEEKPENKPQHKYIESADDIVPWQWYISEPGEPVKFFVDCDAHEEETRYILLTPAFEAENITLSEIIESKFRIAEIHEIPDHCLIGSRVRAWDDGVTEKESGILVKIRKREKGGPYLVYVNNYILLWAESIELIDPKGA